MTTLLVVPLVDTLSLLWNWLVKLACKVKTTVQSRPNAAKFTILSLRIVTLVQYRLILRSNKIWCNEYRKRRRLDPKTNVNNSRYMRPRENVDENRRKHGDNLRHS